MRGPTMRQTQRSRHCPCEPRKFFISTLKEAPADAEIASHRLMLRAGMIKKLAGGIYTYMPLGLKVIRKVEAIIREEMNASGAIELLMPVVQPAELWQESGRWVKYGPELLRIKDRHQRDFVVQPTSEEAITDIARQELRSYKQLPRNFYHVQTKFRDERRPRFGVMRSREFIMKDAYSFDRDLDAAEAQLPTRCSAPTSASSTASACAIARSPPTPVPSAATRRTSSRSSPIPARTRSSIAPTAITPPTWRRPRRWPPLARALPPRRRCRRCPRPARAPAKTSRSCWACRWPPPSSRWCWRRSQLDPQGRRRRSRRCGCCCCVVTTT